MSSPELAFTPRKEFIRDQQQSFNSFALLAISSANCIRLYSFTPALVRSIRSLLDAALGVLSFREDTELNLCEVAVDGKPWNNPKSVATEKLLVDIIAIIYQCGYNYLSTIDYGRENDDRLAMAFSKSTGSPSASRSNSPQPAPPLSSSSSLVDKSKTKRIPFALSFGSTTLMRVISPPLHLTPAILQSVRNSWPRGVVSEKKIGENTFEFKLKGYKWFQQDTFATDSLRHILSLLSLLDQHSFTLLTSVSLTNRSRVKDLWIFTGPAPDNVSADPSQSFLQPSFSLRHQTPPSDTLYQHRRQATEPLPITPQSSLTYTHTPRSATENTHQRPPPLSPQVLRKPAPRAQVPVSVVQRESDVIPDEVVQPPVQIIRAHMPSVISNSVQNMTGVGARPLDYTNLTFPAQFQTNSPNLTLVSPRSAQGGYSEQSRPLRPVSERAKTPPLLTSTSPHNSPRKTPPSPIPESRNGHYNFPASDPNPSNLLGIDVFRNSGHSDSTQEVLVKWTGPLKDSFTGVDNRQRPLLHHKPNHAPTTPILPGGWQPTPISESGESHFPGFSSSNPSSPVKPFIHSSGSGTSSEEKTPASASTPIYENLCRVESPEIVSSNSTMALRKSEAALVGIINTTTYASPEPMPIPAIVPMQSSYSPQREPMHRMDSSNSANSNTGQASLNGGSGGGNGGGSGGGQGWVMVNVDSTAKTGVGEQSVVPVAANTSTSTGTMTQAHAPELTRPAQSESSHYSGASKLSKTVSQGATSPAPNSVAKAIVIVDAMESKHRKLKSTSQTKDSSSDKSAGGGVRRFFSLHRKNSKKVLDDVDETPGTDDKAPADTSVARSNLRDRLRLLGTPQASRKDDKRRSSID